VFFHYDFFKDLKFCYLLGIGVDREQLRNLVVDFVSLFCASMYILHHRNPLLNKRMEKIFWQFPNPNQGNQGLKRMNDEVKKQVKFLYDPLQHTDRKFQRIELSD